MRYIDKTFDVKLGRDLCFGRAGIHATTHTRQRDLLLDVYEPVGRPAGTLSPALVLAFGGAFHRGSKEDDGFEHGGSRSTAMAQYCHEFARRGYVCFSIGYRLVQEDPDPGNTVAMSDPEAIPRSRVDEVRAMLGLPYADNLTLWRGMEGAIDDGATALRWVRDNADRFGIDASRVVAGGWSAGARVAMHAVFAERAPAAAVICISGYMDPLDMAKAIPGAQAAPVFLTWGSKDLDYVLAQGPRFREHFSAIGLKHAAHEIPGANHFYPSTTPLQDGQGGTISLEDAIARFLAEQLQLDS
jgi:acetyl esterase/lipase